MNSTRIWMIGSVTVMIIALIAGWFLGVEPNLTAAAASDTERSGIEAQNTAKQAEIAALTKENENLATIEDEYKQLQRSIPSSSDPAAFISGIDVLAASTGVHVKGITVGASQVYTVPQSAVPAPVPTDPATPAPSSTTPPVPVTPVGSVAATSPLITPANFVGIPVSVEVTGSYQAFLAFVKGLQSGTRLMLVTELNSVVNADDSDVTAHADGMIYVLKQASATN